MPHLFWLSEHQLERIQVLLSQVSWCELCGRVQGVERHHPRAASRPALGGCPGCLWTPQNPLQPFPPLVREECLPVNLLPVVAVRQHSTGVDILLRNLPPAATALVEDKGYDSDKIRAMVTEQGINPCIPPMRNRIVTIYCKILLDSLSKMLLLI